MINMRGSDLMFITLTFVSGLFCGVYLYVLVFAPEYERNQHTPIDTAHIAFLVEGEQYGACEADDRCLAYSIDASGRYAVGPDNDSLVIQRRLEPVEFSNLKSVLAAAKPNALNEPSSQCASATGGNDEAYRIVLEGKEFFLDSCGTQFSNTSLANDLAVYFNSGSVNTRAGGTDFNLQGWLQETLDNSFHYDKQ